MAFYFVMMKTNIIFFSFVICLNNYNNSILIFAYVVIIYNVIFLQVLTERHLKLTLSVTSKCVHVKSLPCQ